MLVYLRREQDETGIRVGEVNDAFTLSGSITTIINGIAKLGVEDGEGETMTTFTSVIIHTGAECYAEIIASP